VHRVAPARACRRPVRSPDMGALKPWHLVFCLLVVVAIVGILVAIIRASRRK